MFLVFVYISCQFPWAIHRPKTCAVGHELDNFQDKSITRIKGDANLETVKPVFSCQCAHLFFSPSGINSHFTGAKCRTLAPFRSRPKTEHQAVAQTAVRKARFIVKLTHRSENNILQGFKGGRKHKPPTLKAYSDPNRSTSNRVQRSTPTRQATLFHQRISTLSVRREKNIEKRILQFFRRPAYSICNSAEHAVNGAALHCPMRRFCLA